MKRTGILMLALAMTFAAGCDDDNPNPGGPSNTGPIVFTAQLSAANEVPPITGPEANARGSVTITFNVPRDSAGNPTGGGSATFAMQLSSFPPNTPANLAHIHTGAQGVPGGIFVDTLLRPTAPILMTDGTANQSITINSLTQDQATQIVANPAGFYFNVHSALNPGGAVRGQLVRSQ
jgi:CHRD domain